MDKQTQEVLRAAEQAVRRLIDCCVRTTPATLRLPRAVARVSRTSRWLLHAVAALRKELATTCAGEASS
jgi:hypothetical protein